uniref:Uncharacterized protein n=1 Tax=Pyrodinium bahamense TaxID=73915 RepID=A0A7S0AJW2_9DINO|mmetsp:Transcript_3602/g.9817  ORF Transcript_3602/g.9817 Transcript_3602/m.9817 type:complete len:436 (+) Transcript_3602:62-1369(+)
MPRRAEAGPLATPVVARRRGGEQKLLAALSDPRLKGSQDGAYFVLRGFGFPASSTSVPAPRIEVFAATQPAVFNALKHLGLQHDGSRFVLRADNGDASKPPRRSLSAPSDIHLLMAGGRPAGGASGGAPVWTAPSHAHREAAMTTPSRRRRALDGSGENEELFKRLALPKVFAKKEALKGALVDAKEAGASMSHGSTTCRRRASISSETVLRHSSVAHSAAADGERYAKGHARAVPGRVQPAAASTAQPGAAARWVVGPGLAAHGQPEESEEHLLFWRPSLDRADPEEQRSYCELLARPRRVAKRPQGLPKVLRQTPAGLAAQRDFCARFAQLQLRSVVSQESGCTDHEAFQEESVASMSSSEGLGSAGSAESLESRAWRTAEWLLEAFEQREPLDCMASHPYGMGQAEAQSVIGQESRARASSDWVPSHKCLTA